MANRYHDGEAVLLSMPLDTLEQGDEDRQKVLAPDDESSEQPKETTKETPSTSAVTSERDEESAPQSPTGSSEGAEAITEVVSPQCSREASLRLPDIELLSVARFLTFADLAQLSLAGGEIANLLTAPASVEQPGACRKLLLPVVEVKLTNMDILKRVSAKHIEILRVWSRGAFEEVRGVMKEEGLHAFAHLEKFSAKGCHINVYDVDNLAPLIAGSPKLSLVNFEKNQFQDNVVTASLVTAFAKSTFEILNLRFNMVSDKTAAEVAGVLSAPHPTLSTVNFKMNRITDVGAIEIAGALKQNQVLRVLNLRRQHPGLTDKSANAFACALDANDSLTRLLLRRNQITHQGCSALADAVARRFARLEQQIAADKPRFELDLEDNKIGVKGALALVRCLQSVGPSADLEVLLHGNPGVERDALRQALIEAGEDPSAADDRRLCIETSKAEHLV